MGDLILILMFVKNTWLKYYLAAIFQNSYHFKNVLLDLLTLLDFT